VPPNEQRVGIDDWDSALADTDGPQLVVAGPGTGKTEFLVRRVAHLVHHGLARRDQIAMLTFSRRAAGYLRRRVDDLVGGSGVPVDASTFHSLALRLLETGSGGLRPVPLTTPEQMALVADLLQTEDPGSWPVAYRGILATPAFASEVGDFLMRCSERLLTPDDLESRAQARADWRGIPGLFRRYSQRLIDLGRTDYGTMLVSATDLLSTDRGRELAAAYRYVLVDEYQDTSPAQAAMARLLAMPTQNLVVAGDPYQSIYSFRGAELRNIAQFAVEHPDMKRIVLDRSLRVPEAILASALRIVSSGELPGSAGPVQPAPHQGRIETYIFDQETAEADWIARDIEQAIRVEGTAPSGIAVLVRSKRQMLNELSRALARRRIPHDPPESRLVEHPAIRLIRDLVTVTTLGGSIAMVSPGEASEADLAMRRLLLGPLIGVGLGKERQITRKRRRTWDPWPVVFRDEVETHPGIAGLIADPSWAVDIPAVDGFWSAWTGLDRLDYLITDPERVDWRLAFTSFAQVLEQQAERDGGITLSRYFDLTDEEGFESRPLLSFRPNEERVTLTTLHQAKGLEFDLVYIANAVEGVFPDLRRGRRMLRPELLSPERTTDAPAQHLFQVQEEMRLAYTAMTRARNRVVWTATEAGVDQGENRPSRFLMAAADPAAGRPGSPTDQERPAASLSEAEIQLRRVLMDPAQSVLDRLVAVDVLAHAPQPWWDARVFAGVSSPGPDQPILGETIRLSPSQANSYDTCPRRYALERRLRLSSSDSPYAQLGTLFHAAVEEAERDNMGSGRPHADVEDALRHLEAQWADANFGTPQLDAAWLERGRKAIRGLYERWPADDGIPIDVERQVDSEIAGVPWVGIIDRLDRMNDGLRVVDYKTSKSPATHADAKSSIQLAFYATAVADQTGDEVVSAEMWFPAHEAKSMTRRSLDIERMQDLRQRMEELTLAIQSEDWRPQANAYCDKCPFRLSCPAWPEGQGAYLP
jgi:superfamily I DNA/RNA helicase/RecB family exonuclease